VFPALSPLSPMLVAVTMLLRVECANEASSSVTFSKDCVTMRLDTAAGARWVCTLQQRSNCNAAAGMLPLILTLEHAIVPDKCKADFSDFNVVCTQTYGFMSPAACEARASLHFVTKPKPKPSLHFLTAALGPGDAQGGARAAVG